MKYLVPLVLLLLLVAELLTRAYAPCGLWNLSRAADVPARCVMHR
ncbi:hypothetical protein ACWC4J_20845 [Streptomyces sp. NPDC001356]